MKTKPFLNAVRYNSDNAITMFGGGINNIYPPEFIQDDEAQEIYNMSLDKYPALSTKIGRTMFKNPGIAGETIQYFGCAGLNYLFYIQKGTTQGATGKLKDVNGVTIAEGLTGTDYNHTYYKDGTNEYLILYGTGQQPTRFKLPLSSYDTPDAITIEDQNQNQVYPKVMCYHKGRMYAADQDILYFSALQNPMDWATVNDSGYIKVTNAKGIITAMESYDDKLCIFSQNNMHELYGGIVFANGETDYNLVDLNNSIGSYSQAKVCNGLLYWLYAKSIYEYNGSAIRAIEQPNVKNRVIGGIKQYLDGILYTEAEKVTIAASESKIYFYFPNYKGKGRLFVFDQRLRKWTQELQPEDKQAELYYLRIADSFNSINFSQTPVPVYALTANGTIYEITGGRRAGGQYIKMYGEDEYVDGEGLVYREPIPFYFKSKRFTEGLVSKKKSLREIWLSYDLDGTANIRVTTDNGNTCLLENALEEGTNKVYPILIPYQNMQNMNSYTIEIEGEGNIVLKQLERKYRIKVK